MRLLQFFSALNSWTSLQIWSVQMKMMKSLLLGSATGLIAVSGMQAADLPVKTKPVEYVKICGLYGEGFYYSPGTDMSGHDVNITITTANYAGFWSAGCRD